MSSNNLSDDLPPRSGHLQRSRNTLPKARQRAGPPSYQTISGDAPPRGVSENMLEAEIEPTEHQVNEK